MSDLPKPWKCQYGHVLGQVMRNGNGVRQLMLFRQAIREGDMVDVDVMAMIEGYVADVRCSVCGRVRTWVPGEEALLRLMESIGRMRKEVSDEHRKA